MRKDMILRSLHVDICFLSDPSPIIDNPCQCLINSLTHSCLLNLIDVNLAFEDASSKLVEIVNFFG